MKLKKFWLVTLFLAMLVSAFMPTVPAQAQDERGISYVPVLQTPHDTILDKTPLYKWTKVSGATLYQYQVYQGSILVLDKSPDSGICGALYCEKSPAETLGYNAYKWRVRAFSGGAWKPWSAYKTFTVSPPSFSSHFNGASMEGWARKGGGTWSLESSNYLYTSGMANYFTSAYKTVGQFTDFDYSAQVLKYGASPAYLAVRMGTDLYYSASEWIPGYIFGYNNAGYVAIWRFNAAGSSTSILGGGTSPAVVGKWLEHAARESGWKQVLVLY